MIEKIIKKLQNTDIITLDEKTLNKAHEITNNQYNTPSEAVKEIITHAYMLYKNNKFNVHPINNSNVNNILDDQYRTTNPIAYNSLSKAERIELKKKIIELRYNFYSGDEITKKLNLSKETYKTLRKQIIHEGGIKNRSYDELTIDVRENAKNIILQHHINGNKTKADVKDILHISDKAFGKLKKEIENDLGTNLDNAKNISGLEQTDMTVNKYRSYDELTAEEIKYATDMIIQHHIKGNKTNAEIKEMLHLSNNALKRLKRYKSYEDLTAEEIEYAKEMILEHHIKGNKTKSEIKDILHISDKSFKIIKDDLGNILCNYSAPDTVKSDFELTFEEREYAKKMIIQYQINDNKPNLFMQKLLNISLSGLKRLKREVNNDLQGEEIRNASYNELTAEEREHVKKLIIQHHINDNKPITYLRRTFHISDNALKKLKKEITDNSSKDKESILAEILKYKRLEIYSDEEIIDMLDLSEKQYQSYLETFYK